jgi:predicted O-linked N-acetylglucosamine transferase (SPINDLY family)
LVAASDEMRDRLINSFDHFLNVEDQSDIQTAQLARNFGIDIAVDLTGHTNDARTSIFAYRAAPIQVNWLGYPGTLGADYFDYIVADKTLIPELHQAFYTEKIAYLPDTYMVDDSERAPSSRVFTREECGLPENAFVFCCFNNSYKFNPQVLDSWSRILKQVENSILWISENSVIFKANLTVEFINRGIDPSRIIFAQRLESMADHLARYALADLFLDTYPYNAHTTAVDSLKAGVPVITLIGQSFASRVAASLLNVVGLPELITSTLDEYVALATELATNHNKFIDLKIKLARNRLLTPLFDTSIFTKNIEAAYIEMYERHQGGLEPSHLSFVSNINHRLN